jgi:hypothetical protein
VVVKSLSEQNLQKSLENLYLVFRVYPFRTAMPCYIPHCFSKEDIEALDKPLVSLSEKDLSSFTWDLLLTCGETEDFKHFLPRLFELSQNPRDHFCDTEIVVGKLARADFTSWPPHEREAVLEFLHDWWQVALEAPSGCYGNTISDLLTGLCCAGLDVKPFLAMWLNTSTLASAFQLTDFVMDNSAKLRLGKKFNAFLEQEHLPVINEWLFSDETLRYLEQAFFTYSENAEAAQISVAVGVLESLREFLV